MLLPGDSLRLLSMYLRHYGLNSSIFRYFRYLPASELAMLLLSLVLIVIAVISLIRIIILSSKMQANRSMKVSAKHVTEEAINCSHSTGRTKYLEQIDGYLKNGLIDRSEYNSLKARYEKLDIPDDYHG